MSSNLAVDPALNPLAVFESLSTALELFSKTFCFPITSFVTYSNASCTFCPVNELVSINTRPCSFANSWAFSGDTYLFARSDLVAMRAFATSGFACCSI